MPRNIIVVSLLVGPPLGGLVAYLVLTLATLPFASMPIEWDDWAKTALLIVPVGYLMGLLPSFLASLANGFVAHSFLSLRARLLIAVPIGIAATFLVFGWLLLPSDHAGIYSAVFGAAGAVSSPATVWLAARPRRSKSEVPA